VIHRKIYLAMCCSLFCGGVDAAEVRPLTPERSTPTTPGAICDDDLFHRRASVVLTGRTPSVAAIENRPTKDGRLDRERLVDKLLQSEHFARAWGRWLAKLTGCQEEPLSSAAFAMKVPRPRVFWFWQSSIQADLHQDRSYTEIVHDLISKCD
jgi:hypothetical protein